MQNIYELEYECNVKNGARFDIMVEIHWSVCSITLIITEQRCVSLSLTVCGRSCFLD